VLRKELGMPPVCDSVIHLCAVRATRLDQVGNPVAGPNNVYITNKLVSIAVTPEIEAGRDLTQVTGCDCIAATYRGPDKLKRFTFELDTVKLEPGLLELMIGATAILGGTDESPIGLWYPEQLSCDDTPQPNVALEGWQYLWEDDHQASDFPYVHWIWPSTRWQIGPHTLNNDFLQPRLTGFSRGNPNFAPTAPGMFGDLPEAPRPLGGFFFSETIPTAECGWQTFPIS